MKGMKITACRKAGLNFSETLFYDFFAVQREKPMGC